MRRKIWKILRLIAILPIVGVLTFYLINERMISQSVSHRFSDINEVPSNDVALVLGASFKTVRGNINPFFYSRMKAVAELYHAKKIKHILVSGDNGRKEYDESTDMKNYLMTLGISESDITLDFAGFRTFDSVVRCKEIFGVNQVTIVSQPFHTPRALFLAKKSGIEAIAYDADPVTYSKKVKFREKFARVKAVLDVYLLGKKPKFLGDKEPIVLNG